MKWVDQTCGTGVAQKLPSLEVVYRGSTDLRLSRASTRKQPGAAQNGTSSTPRFDGTAAGLALQVQSGDVRVPCGAVALATVTLAEHQDLRLAGRTGRACRSVRARHLRWHSSNGRIMKRVHPGGRHKRQEEKKSNRAQKRENPASRQPFTVQHG